MNRRISRELKGRDDSLAKLRVALDEAMRGRGNLVLLSGEAGIGKSALAGVIASEAETLRGTDGESNVRVTRGRAWEFAEAPPYFPLSPCLRQLGINPGAAAAAAAAASSQHEDAFQLWEKVLSALASSPGTTVWIVEDLHAADLGTLDLLTYLAQALHAMNVLIVATTRDKDPRLTADDRKRQRLVRMAREGIEIMLGPLSTIDVAALVETTTGHAIDADTARRLTETTGGNPLFVIECARASATTTTSSSELPATVRQVVLERVALLPENTRAALENAAVLGRETSAALIARMQNTLPTRVIDALHPAVDAGILASTTTKPGHYIFSHVLVRDAIYEAIDPEKRSRLHAKAAAALLLSSSSSSGASPLDTLVERARHALLALLANDYDPAEALALCAEAGRLLEREGAFDRAFDLQTRVADARAAGWLIGVPATLDEELHYAETARMAGHLDVTRAVCKRIIQAARAKNDFEMFARAVLLHAADVRPAVLDRTELLLFEELQSSLSASSPLYPRVLARHATALQPAVDHAPLHKMARTAIEQARALNEANSSTLIYVLDQARWSLYAGPLNERIANAKELLDRAQTANDHRATLSAWIALGFYAIEQSDFPSFDRAVESALVLADDVANGHPRHRWRPLLLASMRSTMLGHFAEADRFLTELTQLAGLIDDPAFHLSLPMHKVLRARFTKLDPADVEEVEKQIATGEVAVPDLQIAFVRARVGVLLGDLAKTRAALDALGTRAPILLSDPAQSVLLCEAYAFAGTKDEILSARKILSEVSLTHASGDGVSFVYEGPTLRVLGLLDCALGDREQGLRALKEAQIQAAEQKHAPWAALIAKEYAERAFSNTTTTTPAMTPPKEQPVLGTAPALRLTKRGEVWHLEGGSQRDTSDNRRLELKDSRGVQLLARLIERADEEIHVLALATDDPSGEKQLAETNAGELLDEKARTAYRKRLSDLEDDLADAERRCDRGHIEKLTREREALASELERAVGLRGRPRVAGSATERARVNVQRRIKDAILRIGEQDPEMGRYLERVVRTGTFCSYRP